MCLCEVCICEERDRCAELLPVHQSWEEEMGWSGAVECGMDLQDKGEPGSTERLVPSGPWEEEVSQTPTGEEPAGKVTHGGRWQRVSSVCSPHRRTFRKPGAEVLTWGRSCSENYHGRKCCALKSVWNLFVSLGKLFGFPVGLGPGCGHSPKFLGYRVNSAGTYFGSTSLLPTCKLKILFAYHTSKFECQFMWRAEDPPLTWALPLCPVPASKAEGAFSNKRVPQPEL